MTEATFDNGVVQLYQGDAQRVLRELPAESVHCAVTSPPYWGLRDYGLEPLVWGGDEGHAHEWALDVVSTEVGKGNWAQGVNGRGEEQPGGVDGKREPMRAVAERGRCPCGAWRGSLGLEPTIDLYVQHIVEVFREVWRVLRKDGTLWLNMGDSYAGSGKGQMGDGQHSPEHGTKQGTSAGTLTGGLPTTYDGLKPKDLCMMPARVALALQADGWWLRSDVVWSKPNPMPESVTDRPTRAHESLFLLAKAVTYYYDAEATREPDSGKAHDRSRKERSHSDQKAWPTETRNGVRSSKKPDGWDSASGAHGSFHRTGREHGEASEIRSGRNKRSVWEIATEPYPEAHFATFPQKLVEPCILAGCPMEGTVLDPFAGSGTVAYVAQRLGRRSIGIDLSPEYLALAAKRIEGVSLPMEL